MGSASWQRRSAWPNSSTSDDIAFAATTKLACWGTFTVAAADDVFVIPGAYGEP
ncbi:MAG: hypothetical protein M3O50_02160 [Myxococcota bacterium]|nr:hypothetical protein [Myxococcota bacterium]